MVTRATVRAPKVIHHAALSTETVLASVVGRAVAAESAVSVLVVVLVSGWEGLASWVQLHWLNIATAMSASGARATQRIVMSLVIIPPLVA